MWVRDRLMRMETKTCEWCGKQFGRADFSYYVNPAALARRRFCSRSCRSRSVNTGRPRAAQPSGSESPLWKGDEVTKQAGRKRARQMYGKQPCQVCGGLGEIHHLDGNPVNNDRSNIAFLCRKHHIQAEDRMAYRRKDPEDQAAHKRALARARAARYRARKRAAAA